MKEIGIHILSVKNPKTGNRTQTITDIITDKGRIMIAGLCFRNPGRLKEHGFEWIRKDKYLRIVNTNWIVVWKNHKKDIARIVQLNLNPINLFWIIFWKLFYKMNKSLH